MLADTVGRMRDDGIRSALGIATSAFGSYSGCRQYREDIEAARTAVNGAPAIEKLPPFWKHLGACPRNHFMSHMLCAYKTPTTSNCGYDMPILNTRTRS
jgi:hypothetical protein